MIADRCVPFCLIPSHSYLLELLELLYVSFSPSTALLLLLDVQLSWSRTHELTVNRPKYSQQLKKGKGSPYSIAERRVPELIPVLGSQPAGDVSHKPGDRLPLLSARPAVTLATLKRAGCYPTNFAVL